jgi:hypothetical protein
MITAASGPSPIRMAAPAMIADVISTCRPPRPKTRRRMVLSRLNDSSRPIRNSRNTTPRLAIPSTFFASTTVTQ